MSTQIAIRTDDITKETIAEFAKSLGLSTSAFMLAAAKESMKRGSVKVTPQYNPEFVKMIRKAEAEYERGEYYTALPGDDINEVLTDAARDC